MKFVTLGKERIHRRSEYMSRYKRSTRHDKIKADPYAINANPNAKRTAGRITATSALQNNSVGTASCTKHAPACRFFEYPQLASRHARGTKARRSSAPHMNLSPAKHYVSPNPHLQRTPATDSRRSACPTSRMDPTRWQISHVRFLRGAANGIAGSSDAKRIPANNC